MLYAALGTLQFAKPPKFLSKSPFDMDLALRAVALGWFDSKRTIPVTIVDIDEETHRSWGSPAITPRAELIGIVDRVTRANPFAIVADIDLAQGGKTAHLDPQPNEMPLLEYLGSYSGSSPLIFAKRIEPGPDGMRRPADSPYDETVRKGPRLAWAHASFTTEKGGMVRWSQDWVEVCADGQVQRLPSVALQAAIITGHGDDQNLRMRAASAEADASCERPGLLPGPRHRLLIGPRLTGEHRLVRQDDAISIPASLLLTPGVALDERNLFAGRIVLIGATHSAAGDNWLTPAGARSGVELLANTVRFWPMQNESTGPFVQFAMRAGAILFFAMFVLFDWRFRPVVALFATIFAVLALVSIAVGLFDTYRVFDVIEAAILLAIVYKALKTTFDFIADLRAQRRDFPRGWRGAFMTFRAACLRDHHGGKGA